MKPWKCNACHTDIHVLDDYEPEYCCEGYECGCYGDPINPMLCDECENIFFGNPV